MCVWGACFNSPFLLNYFSDLSLSLSVILNFENSKEEERMMCEDG